MAGSHGLKLYGPCVGASTVQPSSVPGDGSCLRPSSGQFYHLTYLVLHGSIQLDENVLYVGNKLESVTDKSV